MMKLAAFVAWVNARADAKPLHLAITGAGSGIATWFITWAEYLNLLFKLVGGFFGACGAAAAFLLLLPRILRFARAWRLRGLEHADRE